jgi:hypothetical protein
MRAAIRRIALPEYWVYNSDDMAGRHERPHIRPMAQKHPHADATYRVVPLEISTFGVEVSIPDSSPAMVRSFATRDAAEAWITEHKRQVASEPTLPRRTKFPKPSKMMCAPSRFCR